MRLILSALCTVALGAFLLSSAQATPPVKTLSAGTRTITMVNNCPMDIYWGTTGTPIKVYNTTTQKSEVVSCSGEGTACTIPGGSGTGICGADGQCYFQYPQLSSAVITGQPDFYLPKGGTRTYTASLITRTDPPSTAGGPAVPVIQYTFNIGPQTDCSGSGANLVCQSGACGSRSALFSNQCVPDQGQQKPFTQIEATLNNGSNDFYDLSLINGMNLPVSLGPSTGPSDPSLPSSQSGIQSNFWCTTPGAAPTGINTNLKGCSWSFTPPREATGLPEAAFTQISRTANAERCATDNDCSSPAQSCGLQFPDDLKNYNNVSQPAYCGKALGFYTASTICGLGGVSSDLQNALLCQPGNIRTLQAPDKNQSLVVPVSDIYECKIQSSWSSLNSQGNTVSGSYLDSCYNYKGKGVTTSTFCCGCIDWPGIPTDQNASCSPDPETTQPTIPVTDPDVYPEINWLGIVKPTLAWLIDGCPDAYEYPFGDKHSTIQCSTESVASNPDNEVNYTITFCPEGRTLFPITADASIDISGQDVTVLSDKTATISWRVEPNPNTNNFSSILELTIPPSQTVVDTRQCKDLSCVENFNSLTPNTHYLAKITASNTAGNTTAEATPEYLEFTTNSTPVISIENATTNSPSDSTIEVSWDIESTSTKPVTSVATLSLNGMQISSQSCKLLHCTLNFSGLVSDTIYQITINASANSTSATPVTLYQKTQAVSNQVQVRVPSKGEMKLTNILGPGAYCNPVTYRFPFLSKCQLQQNSQYLCVPETDAGELIGEWRIVQNPSCLVESSYDFVNLNGLIAQYSGVSFQFITSASWQCNQSGLSLNCIKVS